jgi:hypothetical protein
LNKKLNFINGDANKDLEIQLEPETTQRRPMTSNRSRSSAMTSTSSVKVNSNSYRKPGPPVATDPKKLMTLDKMKNYFGTDKFRMTEFLKDMKPKKEKV